MRTSTSILVAGLVCLILGVPSVGVSADDAQREQNLRNVADFERLAFGWRGGGREDVYLVKWEKGIVIDPLTDNKDLLKKLKIGGLVDAWIAKIWSIFPHDITVSRENSNLFVLFYEDIQTVVDYLNTMIEDGRAWSLPARLALEYLNRYPNDAPRPPCFHLSTVQDKRMDKSFVFIPMLAARPHIQSCVDEEFTRALGLTNQHPDIEYSVFNDDDPSDRLTDRDRMFLALLYRDELQSGMTKEEAMPIVRRLLLVDDTK